MTTTSNTPHELAEIGSDGTLRLHFHAGQWKLWNSERRFLVALAGTQSGKTAFGPHWLYREIQRRGPGDYMVITPTYPLLEAKALPELLKLFDTWLGLGKFVKDGRKFIFSPEGAKRTFTTYNPRIEPEVRVMFGYAADPESLEAATAKAAWLDEAGQNKFKLSSWEAIQRRLSIYQGRALLTTTIYNLGWIKQKLYEPYLAGDPDTEISQFASIMNPAFPEEEYHRARQKLPRWKFNMFYRGVYERPAGMIYDVFDSAKHKAPRFALPDHWQRYLGLDFGGVNTAGLFYAQEPASGRLYLYREYKAGGRTAAEHAQALLDGEIMIPICVGGSKSEGQWRDEFRAGGLPVREPDIKEVEVGIDRVYGAHKADEIVVFDDLDGYLDEKESYSRELDDAGVPTEKIADKSSYHFMDAERYIVSWLKRPHSIEMVEQPKQVSRFAHLSDGLNVADGESRWRPR